MKKQELLELIEDEFKAIRELYERKYASYSAKGDVFYNFRQIASRLFTIYEPVHGMFSALLVLKDKHDMALANRGMDDPECESRLRDIIVYCLIGLAMVKEYKNDLG